MSLSEPPDMEQIIVLYFLLFIMCHALIRLSPMTLLHGTLLRSSSRECAVFGLREFPVSKPFYIPAQVSTSRLQSEHYLCSPSALVITIAFSLSCKAYAGTISNLLFSIPLIFLFLAFACCISAFIIAICSLSPISIAYCSRNPYSDISSLMSIIHCCV